MEALMSRRPRRGDRHKSRARAQPPGRRRRGGRQSRPKARMMLTRSANWEATTTTNDAKAIARIARAVPFLILSTSEAREETSFTSRAPEPSILAPEPADFAGDSLHVGGRFARMKAIDPERIRNEINRHPVSLRRRLLPDSLDPIQGALSSVWKVPDRADKAGRSLARAGCPGKFAYVHRCPW